MQQDTIVRSALGNPIHLGQLYNACAEKSCNVSILTESPPPKIFITSTETPNTDSKYEHIKSVRDKFNLLNVAAELQVSLMAGLIQVTGSGKYFKEEKTSARSVSVSLVHKITTRYENLSILDARFREIINLDALKHRNATHVVTGITWGANLIVTAEYNNDEKKDAEEIYGKLSVHLKKATLDIKGQASVEINSKDNLDKSQLNLKIVGDALIPGQMPQTIEGAMQLVGQLTELTKASNDGKGVPIRYELTSLDSIQSYFSLQAAANNLLHSLEQHTIDRIMAVFEDIADAKLKLNEFCDNVRKFQSNLLKATKTQTKELKRESEAAESKFRGQVQILLVEVRSGKANASQLEALKKEYETGPYSALNVLKKINEDFNNVQLKMEELQGFTALGVSVVPGNVRSLPHKLLEFQGKQVYVLYGESEAMGTNIKLWQDHFAAFRKLLEDSKEKDENAFLFVDLDSTPHLKPHQTGDEERKICIQMFDKHGKCVEEDVYKMLMQNSSTPYAKSNKVTKISVKPNYGTVLELICPESLLYEPHSHKWTCYDCKSLIRWDLDEFLYCSCGEGRVDSYKFRCSNTKLGDEFSQFPAGTLEKILDIARDQQSQGSKVSEVAGETHYNNLVYRKARHIIRPLAEAFKCILDNIRLAKEHQERLKAGDMDVEQALLIPVSTLEVVDLKTTRIVCTSPRCVKYCKTKKGVLFCEFPKVCEGPLNFRLDDLPSSVQQRDSILKETFESTMNQDFLICNSCNCPWSAHMPERFTVKIVDSSESVQMETGTVDNTASKFETAVGITNARLSQLKNELGVIYKACVGMEMITAISFHGYPISLYLSWLIENNEENSRMTIEQKKTFVKSVNWFHENQKRVRAEIALQVDAKRAVKAFGEKYYEDFNKNIQEWFDLPIVGKSIKTMAEIQEWRWK